MRLKKKESSISFPYCYLNRTVFFKPWSEEHSLKTMFKLLIVILVVEAGCFSPMIKEKSARDSSVIFFEDSDQVKASCSILIKSRLMFYFLVTIGAFRQEECININNRNKH